MRVVFMGTPDFAVPALDALIAAGHEIAAVYTQPPRAAGRGQREQPSPVHRRAAALGIAVRTPATLRDPGIQDRFAALDADVGVVVAYGLILPPAILEAPRLGCLNIHASLLPRWRGAAPIQHAIWAGDVETGVTIMQMDEGLDTGPMLLAGAVPINGETTAGVLHDTLAALGARLVVEALDGLAAGRLAPQPQPADGASYARKLEKGDARLDWSRPAAALERQVRALDPWPGAAFDHGGERIRVRAAAVVADGAGQPPGTVLEGEGLVIACGEGSALRLAQLQRGGRRPMSDEEMLRGHPIPPGTRFA